MAPSRRAGAETHIALCDECRVLVSAVRRASFVDVAEVTPPVTPAAPNAPATRSHVAPVAAPAAEPSLVEPAPRRHGVLVAAACAGGVLLVVGVVLALVAH